MSLKRLSSAILASVVVIGTAGMARAAAPETVPVADSGNKADTTGYGDVAYEYKIGKYEVTNTEYCEFLNAVAKSDSHGLYDPRMGGRDDRTGEAYGGITRSGWYGKYVYKVRPGAANWPVGYVTWESAARYANWLTNGAAEGSDTEKGCYTFKWGEVKVADHATLAAAEKTTWAIASENEWYKAAYYDAKKSGGAGYWKYPAKSDWPTDANINSNQVRDAGSFPKAASAYGTFDQGGNLWEYNDNRSGGKVGLRGGSFYINDNENYMRSTTRYDVLSAKWPNYGFRVVALGGSEEAK